MSSARSYLQEAYNGTLRMNRLIGDLLNFSRLAHVEPNRETVDLSSMAQEVAAELKSAEPERRVAFRIADGIAANGDANLLRVVLNNLLGNAWKYTGKREEAVIEFGVTEIDGSRPISSGTTGKGLTWRMRTSSSSPSSAFQAPRNSEASASAWQRWSGSSGAMAGGYGPKESRAKGRPSTSPCRARSLSDLT